MSITAEAKTLLASVQNLYIGSMPASPDNAVCIYPTGGYDRGMSGTFLEEPTFQVKIRNTSYDAGEALCETIKDLLHGKSTSKALVIMQQGDAMGLGRDEKNREQWTLNFKTYYRR